MFLFYQKGSTGHSWIIEFKIDLYETGLPWNSRVKATKITQVTDCSENKSLPKQISSNKRDSNIILVL